MPDVRYIFTAACEAELAPLRVSLADQPVDFFVCGIGSTTAAANLAAFLSDHRDTNSAIIFVGSCGSLDRSVPLLTPVLSRSARLADYLVATNRGYLPEFSESSGKVEAGAGLLEKVRGAIGDKCVVSDVYSPVGITSDPAAAHELSENSGAGFENLELFGVATACSVVGVPWCGVLPVTNYIYEDGHQEWVNNHQKAAEIIAELFASDFTFL